MPNARKYAMKNANLHFAIISKQVLNFSYLIVPPKPGTTHTHKLINCPPHTHTYTHTGTQIRQGNKHIEPCHQLNEVRMLLVNEFYIYSKRQAQHSERVEAGEGGERERNWRLRFKQSILAHTLTHTHSLSPRLASPEAPQGSRQRGTILYLEDTIILVFFLTKLSATHFGVCPPKATKRLWQPKKKNKKKKTKTKTRMRTRTGK